MDSDKSEKDVVPHYQILEPTPSQLILESKVHFFHNYLGSGGWRDGSAAKSTGSFYMEPMLQFLASM